jgi:hypothetical protein
MRITAPPTCVDRRQPSHAPATQRPADAQSLTRILAIDFEASCLPRHGRSYPIEVGIADETGAVRSWLIRPAAQWRGWTWTQEAQALHRLTLEQLFDEGQPIESVAPQLDIAIQRQLLFADSYIDDYWMRTLMTAAGRACHPKVDHIDALIDKFGLGDDQVRACVAVVDRQGLPRHRAGDDARWLALLIAGLRESRQTRERMHDPFPRGQYHGRP